MSASAKRVFFLVGRRGVVVSQAALQLALGGYKTYSAVVQRLTVRERVPPNARTKFGHPPKPKLVLAYKREHGLCPQTGRPGQPVLYLPCAKLAPLFNVVSAAGVATPTLVNVPEDPAFADLRPLAPPEPPPTSLPPTRFPPYDYQAAVARHILDHLSPGVVTSPRSYYLCMDTGLGKSVTALLVAAAFGPGLFIVPTQALADQLIEEARNLFGPEFRVAQYTNVGAKARAKWEERQREIAAGTRRARKAKEPPAPPTAKNTDLAVVVVNTARDKPPEFFEGWASVVLDEAHELCSAQNYKVLWATEGVPRRLALSASPLDRFDELDQIVTKHVGDPIDAEAVASAGGAPMADVRFRGEVREIWYEAPPGMDIEEFNGDMLSASGTMRNAGKDECRARLIAAEVERLYNAHLDPELAKHYGFTSPPDEDHEGPPEPFHIFIFSELRDYLDTLAVALRDVLGPDAVWLPEMDDLEEAEAKEKGETPARKARGGAGEIAEAGVRAGEFRAVGGSAAILRGGSADKTRTRARDTARITLMTYGYGRRGLSFKKYAAFVAATPRKAQWRQITGRILRRGGDQRVLRCIVDIVDASTRLKNQVRERRKINQKVRNFEVRRIDARAADFARPGAKALEAGPAGGKLLK